MTTPPYPTITDELLSELEEAARNATPGPWELTVHTNDASNFDAVSDDWTIAVGGNHVVAMEDGIRESSDVVFIAKANPSTLLALIAHIRELEKDSARLDWLDRQGTAYGVHCHEGNRWELDGPFRTARDAIDADMKVKP